MSSDEFSLDDFVLPDLSGIEVEKEEKKEFEPIPQGSYLLYTEQAKYAKSRQKGTPSINVKFQIVKGPYTNRRLWHDLWLTPGTAPMLAEFLERLKAPIAGAKLNSLNKAAVLRAIEDRLVVGFVVIEQNDPQYPPKNRIAKFYTAKDEDSVYKPKKNPQEVDWASTLGPETASDGGLVI